METSGADFRRLMGAVLMGVGAVCTMGCTVGQGLSGISTLSAIDLRQKVDASQQRTADDLRKNNEDNTQLRRSMLDLSNQIEVLRSEVATMRGENEKLARAMADIQRSQKDPAQGVEEGQLPRGTPRP